MFVFLRCYEWGCDKLNMRSKPLLLWDPFSYPTPEEEPTGIKNLLTLTTVRGVGLRADLPERRRREICKPFKASFGVREELHQDFNVKSSLCH